MRGAALAVLGVAMVDLREVYQSAVDAHRRGDLPTALSRYRDVIKLNPGIAAVHNNVAAICLSQGEVAEAEASWRTAVGLQSNYPEAHFNLAVLLSERASDSDAARRAVLLLLCDDPPLHNLRCPPCCCTCVTIHPLHNRRLEALADAARHCAAALEHRPAYVAAHHLMGNILVSQDRPDAAKLHYQLASSLADATDGPPAALPARWDGVSVGFAREVAVDDGEGPSARTMRTLSLVPLILEIPEFLAPAECDAIVDLASPRLQATPTTTTTTPHAGLARVKQQQRQQQRQQQAPPPNPAGLARDGRCDSSRAHLTKRLAAADRVGATRQATAPRRIRAKAPRWYNRDLRGPTGEPTGRYNNKNNIKIK